MREKLKGIVSDGGAAFERRSDWPELTPPAFQSYFSQEVMLMRLILKVVYKLLTIVLELRWDKPRR
jgi:hypothetical protein